jgi:hypothetical protein
MRDARLAEIGRIRRGDVVVSKSSPGFPAYEGTFNSTFGALSETPFEEPGYRPLGPIRSNVLSTIGRPRRPEGEFYHPVDIAISRGRPVDTTDYDELNEDITTLDALDKAFETSDAERETSDAERKTTDAERLWKRIPQDERARITRLYDINFREDSDMGRLRQSIQQTRDILQQEMEVLGLPPSEVGFMGDPFGHGRKRRKVKQSAGRR